MARKKNSMSRKRNGTKERIWLQVQLNCLTGLGRSGLGRQCLDWGQSRDVGLGRAGAGGGGHVCSYIKKCSQE